MVFRLTLLRCGHSYDQPLWRQEQVPFMRAHENTFPDWGGMPVSFDSMTLRRVWPGTSLYDPDISEPYAAFAKHWGLIPLPCRPRHPQEDDIVERGGNYLKDNALKGRRFNSLEELSPFPSTGTAP